MFEDRNKSGYNFEKYDKIARTTVLTETKNDSESEAHKKLFNYQNENKNVKEQLANEIKENLGVIKHVNPDTNVDNLPSSSYLKQYLNQTIGDESDNYLKNSQFLNEKISLKLNEQNANKGQTETTIVAHEDVKSEAEVSGESGSEIDYVSLIDNVEVTKNEEDLVKKELQKLSPKINKSFSFRIKLLGSVYLILVVLFGGWVIGNAIDLSNTNSLYNQAITQTEQVNQNIFDIVTSINNLNNASGDPNDETLLVKISTEEIEITPSEVIPPNEYNTESNWFDAFTNWLGGLFGG